MRRATIVLIAEFVALADISIHALHEESDQAWLVPEPLPMTISIHALHEESDHSTLGVKSACREFQSTLSMRRATGRKSFHGKAVVISIHALHEESDPVCRKTFTMAELYFNPRSP